jgi:hypothetical protein
MLGGVYDAGCRAPPEVEPPPPDDEPPPPGIDGIPIEGGVYEDGPVVPEGPTLGGIPPPEDPDPPPVELPVVIDGTPILGGV